MLGAAVRRANLRRAPVRRAAAAVLAGTLPLTLPCAAPLPAQAVAGAVAVPFEPSRWAVDAPRAAFVEHLGRPSLHLTSGSALLRDVRFDDGVIELDVSAPAPGPGFAFVVFRAASAADREDVYLRMGSSGAADAVQYQPTFGRTGAWQLYHGPGYTAPAVFERARWTRLRVEVAGPHARVFVGESAEPVLEVAELRRGPGAGAVGVLEGTSGAAPGVYFSNFRYTPRPPVARVAAAARPAAPAAMPPTTPGAPSGAIRRWELSPAVATGSELLDALPAAARGARRDWVAAEAEPSGLLNVARYRAKAGPRSLVLARAVVRAERDEVRRLAFGYSDDVTVFLNGRPLFAARNGFRARYPSAAGLVTPHDVVFLPLRRGENELVLAVAEEFGGWGLVAQLGGAAPGSADDRRD
jgi:hypothetical protein